MIASLPVQWILSNSGFGLIHSSATCSNTHGHRAWPSPGTNTQSYLSKWYTSADSPKHRISQSMSSLLLSHTFPLPRRRRRASPLSWAKPLGDSLCPTRLVPAAELDECPPHTLTPPPPAPAPLNQLTRRLKSQDLTSPRRRSSRTCGFQRTFADQGLQTLTAWPAHCSMTNPSSLPTTLTISAPG